MSRTSLTPERPVAAADEAALVRAAQAGDRAAFGRLVEAYWPRLYRWLCHLTPDRHQAEDLAQEAVLKAMAALHRFTPGTNFRAWLFRIAHNALANQHRASARRRDPLPDDLPARGDDPAGDAVTREFLADVRHAVDALPPDFRAALLLRTDEDLSFRQIAEILDTTEETARWRVFKARQKLMERLGPRLTDKGGPA